MCARAAHCSPAATRTDQLVAARRIGFHFFPLALLWSTTNGHQCDHENHQSAAVFYSFVRSTGLSGAPRATMTSCHWRMINMDKEVNLLLLALPFVLLLLLLLLLHSTAPAPLFVLETVCNKLLSPICPRKTINNCRPPLIQGEWCCCAFANV